MRKNLILSVIFFILLSFAYLWEQKGHKEIFVKNQKLDKVFSFSTDQVTSLTLKNTKIFKDKEGNWLIGELDYNADKSKINFILKTISGLSIVSKIKTKNKQSSDFFVHQDHAFTIKTYNQEFSLRLGDISHVTGYFYLEIYQLNKKELYLVKDTNFYEGLYKNEIEAEFQKYLAFKKIITTTPMELIQHTLMSSLDWSKVKNIKFKRKSRKVFTVDLVNNRTTPPTFEGISYASFLRVIESMWTRIHVSSILKNEKNVLSDVLSEVKIDQEGVFVTFTLFGKMNGKVGNFVTSNTTDWIYIIESKGNEFFFADIQDFWSKTFPYPKPLTEYKRFKFKLGYDGVLYNLKVEDINKFEIESDDERIDKLNTSNLNLLFNVMFNLLNFDQATFVLDEFSKLDSNTPVFELHLFEKQFKIQFKKSLIIVQDLDKRLEFHFSHQNSTIKIDQYSDFFTLANKRK